jgi:hypothetical protein
MYTTGRVGEGRGLETNTSQALKVFYYYYYNYSTDYLLINVGYEPTNINPTRFHHEAAVAAPAASREGQGLETGVS